MRIWLDDERDPKDPFIQEKFGSKFDDVWAKPPKKPLIYLKLDIFFP
jgi:hypothetical protein